MQEVKRGNFISDLERAELAAKPWTLAMIVWFFSFPTANLFDSH